MGLLLPDPSDGTPSGDWRDTIAPQPTSADAWDATSREYRAWQERDRQQQIALGNVDPETGKLTPQGWQQQAQTIGGGFGPADVGALGVGAIKAYHGSPHVFDRFDMSKIGTGEGNQAYGHGLYFAGNENVAKTYRPNEWQSEYSIGGKSLNDVYDSALNRGDYGAAAVYERIMLHEPRARMEQYFAADAHENPQSARALQVLKTIPDSTFGKPAGNMYEVNLNVEPQQLLNYDKPIGAQPKALRDLVKERLAAEGYGRGSGALRAYNMERGGMAEGQVPSLIGDRSPLLGTSPGERAVTLRDAGIPGIKYLDQGSRERGRGSHNYVMLDDKLIDIARRYALPGLMTGGAAAMPFLTPDERGGLL